MYQQIVRPLLFQFEPEQAHHIATSAFKFTQKLPLGPTITKALYKVEHPKLKRTVMGLNFENPVGLAAGFDKNAAYYNEFANLGFGFVEIGTVTPLAQPGNPQPRMFRLPADKALINRMGFNNGGLELAVQNLKSNYSGVLIGGNIGKNKVTPNDEATRDYVLGFEGLYDYVDYFVVNVSSPNTPNLRELQDKEPLKQLLGTLQDLNAKQPVQKPIVLKIAPDVSNEQLDDIVEIVQSTGIAGITATNTTISRAGLTTTGKVIDEAGGLSGKIVRKRSTEVIQYLRSKLPASVAIIGVGGIFTGEDALEKLQAGADLVQVYTGFIYEGPAMVRSINRYLIDKL